MTIRSRMLKLRKLQVPLASGTDPDVIDIDDGREAVGDWPLIEETCPRAPAGQCEYSHHDKWTRCIHCGRPSGFDE